MNSLVKAIVGLVIFSHIAINSSRPPLLSLGAPVRNGFASNIILLVSEVSNESRLRFIKCMIDNNHELYSQGCG